ncbi:DUF6932 family protein [Fibrella forsythiae]|uniref:Polymerase nucleotidyl transferase domain-containing protein n=1 Tax=Fibrella forsythiae TaxID=2817061 RepID=A0ABS3JFF2_9BACT|nr:hypothetical protein [Fibrella forsythiae]MBO0948720.1 hypothetical protein [Fibrella forsythiae]
MTEFVFDSHGYLIPNDEPILADKASVNHQFGCSSVLRRSLWNDVEKLMEILSSYLLPVVEVWIDGSFISQKTDPDDVDVVIFISHAAYIPMRAVLDALGTSFVQLDVKWIPVLDASDSHSAAINALERMKWFALFNSDRNGLPKGFVSLKIN